MAKWSLLPQYKPSNLYSGSLENKEKGSIVWLYNILNTTGGYQDLS